MLSATHGSAVAGRTESPLIIEAPSSQSPEVDASELLTLQMPMKLMVKGNLTLPLSTSKTVRTEASFQLLVIQKVYERHLFRARTSCNVTPEDKQLDKQLEVAQQRLFLLENQGPDGVGLHGVQQTLDHIEATFEASLRYTWDRDEEDYSFTRWVSPTFPRHVEGLAIDGPDTSAMRRGLKGIGRDSDGPSFENDDAVLGSALVLLSGGYSMCAIDESRGMVSAGGVLPQAFKARLARHAEASLAEKGLPRAMAPVVCRVITCP